MSISFEATISVFESAEKGNFEEVSKHFYYLSVTEGSLHSIITKMVKTGKERGSNKVSVDD